MRRAGLLLVTALAAGAGAASLGGRDVFGDALTALGLPDLGAAVMARPGPALYAAGRHGEAAAAFAEAGERYNEGVAAARAGDYAAALAAFDAAIAENPHDASARANYDLVAQLFAGTRLQGDGSLLTEEKDGETLHAEIGQGNARASSTGTDTTNASAGFQVPELIAEEEQARVRKVFDAHHLAASRRWLATLADEPGLFLKDRLAAVQAARQEAGAALPPAEDPE